LLHLLLEVSQRVVRIGDRENAAGVGARAQALGLGEIGPGVLGDSLQPGAKTAAGVVAKRLHGGYQLCQDLLRHVIGVERLSPPLQAPGADHRLIALHEPIPRRAIGGALSKTHHQGDRGVVVRILQHGRNCAFWRPATTNPRGSPPWRSRLESDRAAAHTHVPGYRRIGSRKRTACHLKLWIAQVSQGGSGLMISWCSPYWRDSF